MKINKALLATIAAAAILAADGAIAQAAVFVRTAPPPPRSVRVVGRSPGRGFVWTNGYYRWGGRRYVWTPGRWRRPPRSGAVWVSPRWRARRGGYTFVAGRWR
jgi:hypothetical protein